jgi:hypothetical protein
MIPEQAENIGSQDVFHVLLLERQLVVEHSRDHGVLLVVTD